MSQSSYETSKAFLKRSEDWIIWERQFKTQAIDLQLWDHIANDEPLLRKPQRPQVAVYQRQGQAQASSSSRGRGTAAGTRSQTVEAEGSRPATMSDLSDVGRIAYQTDIQLYIQEEKDFKEQNRSVQILRKWVMESVAPHFGKVACEPEETLYQWYDNLKKHAGISNAKEFDLAHEKYREAVRPLTKPKDWSKWLATWEETMLLAIRMKVPEAISIRVWTKDFFYAISPIASSWVTTSRMIYKTQIEQGTLIFRDLANDFREHMASDVHNQRIIPRVAKGAFGPSYAGQDTPDQGTLEDAQGNAGVASIPHSRKRREREREMSPSSLCIACDQSHRLTKCYYIFPDKAPTWWKENPETRAYVDQQLKENTALREEIQSIKGKRSRSGTPRGSRSRRGTPRGSARGSRTNTPGGSRSNTPRGARKDQNQDQDEPDE
jgi:hypothetical protein